MKTVESISFEGKRALIRVDFNVAVNEAFEVTDNTRIKAALPTIQKILKDGGSVVLMSHFGRPKNGPEKKHSLQHVLPELERLLEKKVLFVDDCISANAFKITSQLKPKEIVLLENLRFYKEEEKGDELFAAQLSKHGDIYVNDAFGAAHRAHASTSIIAQFFPSKKCFGLLMAKEVESLQKALDNPKRPLTAVIGGAKVSSKLDVIKHLLNKVDKVLVGGGMAFTFIKALGGDTGKSLIETEMLPVASDILQEAKKLQKEFVLPIDAVIADAFSVDAKISLSNINSIPANYMGLDIGPETEKIFHQVLLNSKTILWNGPMGVFEMPPFAKGTISVAKSIAESTKLGAFSLVGGGDSVAAVNQFGLANDVSYVSTGGGAMLEYLEGKTLPGVAAILN